MGERTEYAATFKLSEMTSTQALPPPGNNIRQQQTKAECEAGEQVVFTH